MLNRGWLFLIPAGLCFVASCMSPFSRMWAIVAILGFVVAGFGWMVRESDRKWNIKPVQEHDQEFVGALLGFYILIGFISLGIAMKGEDNSYMPVTLSRTILGVASGLIVVCGIRVFVIERALEREERQRSPDR